MSEIEIKQHRGKTAYSWALIRNSVPILSGLTLEQAISEKEKMESKNDKNKTKIL